MEWQSVIGLEVHVQLNTKSKIFSGSSTEYGNEPNSQACMVDLGFPGVLPVLNKGAVVKAIKFGLGVGAAICKYSVFARKNYFYPDLPKGYQISQFELPIVGQGDIEIQLEDGSTRVIGITRAHLEEDAGKSLHEDFHGFTGIDLNRAGVPLLEVVSEPDMRNAEEAVAYLKALHTLVRYLDICDGNMQEGSFRCDANVSIRPRGSDAFGTRTEIKNVNSFRFVEKAINYEIARQIAVLENGGVIHQETRLYDSVKDETRPMRSKEEADDYRYFPDPDLLPVELTDEFIAEIKTKLPELPQEKLHRFIDVYKLDPRDADALIANQNVADYFENVVAHSGGAVTLALNWVTGDLAAALNKNNVGIDHSPVSSESLGGLLKRIADDTISGKIAKSIFESMWNGESGDADELIAKKGLQKITDTAVIDKMIDEVIANHPDQVAAYKAGKEQLLGFFVGQIMKASGGKADPKILNIRLREKLNQ